MTRRYETLVAEGRRAAAAEGEAQWHLGDLAIEVAEIGEAGQHTGVYVTLQQFADDVGVGFESLRQNRRVAEAWPAGKRLPAAKASFGVHQVLAGEDDRFSLIRDLVREGGGRCTVNAARRALGRRPTCPAPDDDDDVERTRRRLRTDPVYRHEVLSDPATAKAVRGTQDDLYNQQTNTSKRRQREADPDSTAAREYLDIVGHLSNAHAHLKAALNGLRDTDSRAFSNEQRAALREWCDWNDSALALVREYAKARQVSTLAEEVEEFLAQQ